MGKFSCNICIDIGLKGQQQSVTGCGIPSILYYDDVCVQVKTVGEKGWTDLWNSDKDTEPGTEEMDEEDRDEEEAEETAQPQPQRTGYGSTGTYGSMGYGSLSNSTVVTKPEEKRSSLGANDWANDTWGDGWGNEEWDQPQTKKKTGTAQSNGTDGWDDANWNDVDLRTSKFD